MGIIGALKKQYRYIYLKDILDFNELNKELERKREFGKRLQRDAAWVFYVNPTHLLDVASYVKEAWNSISSKSIKNVFCNAELINLKPEQDVESKISLIVVELAETISNLNLSIDETDLENFAHTDDKSNEKYAAAVLEDVK